jgi:hypothetical protein
MARPRILTPLSAKGAAPRTKIAKTNGKPIDPRHDQYEWKALLAEANQN